MFLTILKESTPYNFLFFFVKVAKYINFMILTILKEITPMNGFLNPLRCVHKIPKSVPQVSPRQHNNNSVNVDGILVISSL